MPPRPISLIAGSFILLAGALLSHAAPTTSAARQWLLQQPDVDHYPFEVHLPDRTTRNLPPLAGPPPLLLSLSGSGARGNASQAARLAGYDGTARQVRYYNSGEFTGPSQLAAEEFLVVVPISPIESSQADADWDIAPLPGIIASVAAQYQVDLTRIYLTSYSMGSRAAWRLVVQNPALFAGVVISSGSTAASLTQLEPLLGVPIRNFYGDNDEDGLAALSVTTQQNYDEALRSAPASVNKTNVLETIEVPGADHLTMTERPWDPDVLVDGNPGALSWLLKQRRTANGVIPGIILITPSSSSTVTSSSGGTATSSPTATSSSSSSGLSPASAQASKVSTAGRTSSRCLVGLLFACLAVAFFS